MVSSDAGCDSSARRLEQLQTLLQLGSDERRRELERLRQSDPEAGAALDDLLARHTSTRDDGFLIEDFPVSTQSLPPGTWVGPYEIVRLLGRGGMGVVYLARRHEPYRQDVALKRMRPGLPDRLVARFHAERQILATLVHPDIVRLLDGGTDADGSPYLVMEYVAGPRLDEHCRRHATALEERVRLVHAVAEALAHAHRQGIVHRDLKPSNVLVGGDGRPRVTDFGLAKLVSATGSAAATETGLLLGTPHYMAPERLAQGPGRDEPGVDVYALGVILFALAANRLPFTSDDTIDGYLRAIREDVPTLRRVVPSIPRDLETIATRALARDPRDRFADAGELAEQLRRFLAREPLTIRPPTAADRLARWAARHRRPLLAWGVSFALALLTMIGILVAWNRDLQRDRDALRATMRSFWLASAGLVEALPPDEPALRPFYEDLARFSDDIRGQGLLPIDPWLERQVAVMHRHLATSLDASGKSAEALSHLDKSVALLRPLPAKVAAPTSRAWTEFDLFRGLTLRSAVHLRLGRPDLALSDADEGLRLIRGLVDRFPTNPAWREAQARHHLGRVAIFDRLGRPDDARRASQDALELAGEAVELAPDEGVNLNTLLTAHLRVADHSSDLAEKELQLRTACEVAERIGKLPGGGDWSNHGARVDALTQLGSFLLSQGRPAEALSRYSEANSILDRILAVSPQNQVFQSCRVEVTRALDRCREQMNR